VDISNSTPEYLDKQILVTVYPLLPNTAYDIVLTTHLSGASAVSLPVTITTPSLEFKPVDIAITSILSDAITISWSVTDVGIGFEFTLNGDLAQPDWNGEDLIATFNNLSP
jgi:hypothetical protein